MPMYYTAKQLIEAYHFLKDNPNARIKTGQWPYTVMDWQQWRKWFNDCLNNKINRDYKPVGKKDSDQYLRDLRHDISIIRDYTLLHIRHSGRNILNTPECKWMYPDIDNTPNDF